MKKVKIGFVDTSSNTQSNWTLIRFSTPSASYVIRNDVNLHYGTVHELIVCYTCHLTPKKEEDIVNDII